MKIELIVPDSFRKHYQRDKFVDSLERVSIDLESQSVYMSGKYELETIDMLAVAFKNSREVKDYEQK